MPKNKLFIAFILLFTYILVGCSQSKKLQRAKDTMLDNPAELAKICSERFPAKETTIYIPGETVIDTVFSFQEVMIPVECPPSDSGVLIQWKVKTVRETVKETKVDTVHKVTVDKAREFYLESRITELEQLSKKQGDKIEVLKKYRNWMWILIIIAVIGGGLWFWFRGKTSVINSIINKAK